MNKLNPEYKYEFMKLADKLFKNLKYLTIREEDSVIHITITLEDRYGIRLLDDKTNKDWTE